MKNNVKRAFFGSVLAFFIGTSCCWLSAVAVWFGGFAFLGSLITFIENTQILILSITVVIAVLSLFLYFRNRINENEKN